jgi:hypothetical protein
MPRWFRAVGVHPARISRAIVHAPLQLCFRLRIMARSDAGIEAIGAALQRNWRIRKTSVKSRLSPVYNIASVIPATPSHPARDSWWYSIEHPPPLCGKNELANSIASRALRL